MISLFPNPERFTNKAGQVETKLMRPLARHAATFRAYLTHCITLERMEPAISLLAD